MNKLMIKFEVLKKHAQAKPEKKMKRITSI